LVRGSILLADDDALFRAALRRQLESEGYDVSDVAGPEAALQAIERRPFDVVLTDLKMPGQSGVELIQRIRSTDPEAVCIVITGFGSPESSIEALDAGAFWFIEKNYERMSCLGPLIGKALELRQLRTSNQRLQRQLQSRYGFESIIGHSEPLLATLEMIRKVSDSDATVLVLGESGVGKELVARALHVNSHRSEQPFVAVNCGAIPEQLLESELFGHVKGAYTGALRDRVGRFAAAAGGTLFLDEIGDMSPSLQTKLLRVLQEKTFESVGSNKTESVDVRIVAATNQNLQQRISEGAFREDLYFRLAVIPIEVPPLRERRDDIPLLVEHFLAELRADYPEVKGMTETALKRLVNHEWPGNVRQLRGMVERLTILKRSGWIDETDLPAELLSGVPERPTVSLPPDGVDFQDLVGGFERDLIVQALHTTGWNKNRAAGLLGLKRTTLVEKIRAKGIEAPEA
jgi:DNA-binding NtrC family response regulator